MALKGEKEEEEEEEEEGDLFFLFLWIRVRGGGIYSFLNWAHKSAVVSTWREREEEGLMWKYISSQNDFRPNLTSLS